MRNQQIKLLVLWFFLTGLTFVFLFLLHGIRGAASIGSAGQLTQWIGATLMGMIATLIAQERNPALKAVPPASRFVFWLTVVLCIFYWLTAFGTILMWSLRGRSDEMTLAAWLMDQLPWITVLQASLLALLFFFFNKMRKSGPDDMAGDAAPDA